MKIVGKNGNKLTQHRPFQTKSVQTSAQRHTLPLKQAILSKVD